MGRIADAAVHMLATGPAPLSDLSAALSARGVTRAKDPLSSVRRALRNDPRLIETHDGRVARLDRTLTGVRLTARVDHEALERGRIEAVDDLSPLRLLGVLEIDLPGGLSRGDLVLVEVVDPASASVTVTRIDQPPAPLIEDEAALTGELAVRFAHDFTRGSIGHLPSVFAAVAADGRRFRRAGRPITEVLRDAGWEAELGWVGPAGTPWADVAREEADALEDDIADMLLNARFDAAAAAQERLLTVLRRHLPERVAEARRRLARMLARGGRPDDGVRLLEGAFPFDDPEDRYEAVILALRVGDVARARRLVEEGLARAHAAEHAEVRACLEDIAGDLDAQAAVERMLGVLDADSVQATDVAAAIVAPRRSYLVEMLVERVFQRLDAEAARRLVDEFAIEGERGLDACHACAAVLPSPLAEYADDAAGDAPARRPWVRGLIDAVPAAAWSTVTPDGGEHEHLIITVTKERGRVAALVVLCDRRETGGAIRNAFFLPDLITARFGREVLSPLEDNGVPCERIPLETAVAELRRGMLATDPASDAIAPQVWERITRWVVTPPGEDS